MRILRGLSSRVLPCGCLTGVYETYASEVIRIVDARGPQCVDPSHQPGDQLTRERSEVVGAATTGRSDG